VNGATPGMGPVRSVPLASIRFDRKAWPRQAIDAERVAQFASLYQERGPYGSGGHVEPIGNRLAPEAVDKNADLNFLATEVGAGRRSRRPTVSPSISPPPGARDLCSIRRVWRVTTSASGSEDARTIVPSGNRISFVTRDHLRPA